MTNPWFKFYGGEYLSDPKMLNLNGNERSCWITLMCLFSQNNGEEIKFLSEKQLLYLSRIQDEIQVLDRFEELGLISRCNGNVTLPNWEKRQYSEGYSRVKKFRDNKKITIEEKREEEKRIDKEEELPLWLNKKAWEAWQQHRKEKGKKLTPYTIKLQLKLLEENQKDHAQIIKNSITNGWTGLFPIKEEFKTRKQSAYQEPNTSKEDNERSRFLTDQSKSLANKFKV